MATSHQTIILVTISCLLIVCNTAWGQDMVILNHRNLFVQIEDSTTFKFSGLVEIIKPDISISSYRSKYATIFRMQKEQYQNIAKKVSEYMKDKKFAEKCTFKYILQLLEKAQNYINEILDVKIKWANCTIKDTDANKQFENLWKELFYTFNEKPKPKKKYGEIEEKKPKDSPLDEENYLCLQNAPYLFCEIVHYFLFRFFIKRSSEEKTFYKLKKVDFTKDIMEGILKQWQSALSEICSEPDKIDYMQELDSKDVELDKIIPEPTVIQEEPQDK